MTSPQFSKQNKHRFRLDYRLRSFLLATTSVVLLGYLISLLPGNAIDAGSRQTRPQIGAGFDQLKSLSQADQEQRSPEAIPDAVSTDPRQAQAQSILKQAAAEVEAGRYDDAIATLNRGRPLVSDRAEAYLNMGNALLGKRDFNTARDFLAAAIDRNPGEPNAYFGFAIASEGLGDLESALGAMRSFLHLQKNPDPYRLKVAQARSAIWEWEAKLGRGEWGPTKGIPPGFTAAELQRDGKGVGIKMPVKDSEGPDGQMRYEIKAGKRIQQFKP